MLPTPRIALFALIALSASWALPLAARAVPLTVEVQPDATTGKDTFVDSRGGSANANFGTSSNLVFGHADLGVGTDDSYIYFDLTGLPTTGITSVELWLYCTGPVDGAGSPLVVPIRAVLGAWSEATLTWNTQPSVSGNYGQITMTNAAGWDVWTITSLYQAWVGGTIANQGLQVDGSGSNNGEGFSVYSSEYVADPTLRPKLVVNYDGPAPVPEPASLAFGALALAGTSLAGRRRRR